jgi:NADH-quinone oxidoreductase subunit L
VVSAVDALVTLVIALPLAGAAILLLGGRLTDRWGPYLATLLPIVSFVFAVILFVHNLAQPDTGRSHITHLYTWMNATDLHVGADLLYDQLSSLFLLLITGVGSLIHVYSLGYMAHDPRRRRFFAYLNLFVAAMLTLVLAANYLVLFLGWEGVGLASYLLIGFWQHKPSAAAAAKKAFVMNRVGDMGLSLAIALCFTTFGSTAFSAVNDGIASGSVSEERMTWLGLLLLLGACGKSAQVPLQAWLLDAMEGPTPVSALIHAATMVTAGVYLMVRSHAVLDAAPGARTAVVIVAVVTLLWGATIGCAKDDIKKVLAGSTMSQIGYMMLAAGLGPAGYAFAIFHLLTHGFFKANMFLGAGSVMHAMDDDVDMRHYGALSRAMPVTFLTFAMGYLAIIGFPGFSGFWSKDKIIDAAWHEHWWIGALALLGAGITAFYMTRLMLMTFFTDRRWRDGVHPHESPNVMTGPLVVLAALSVLGGVLLIGSWIQDYLAPLVGEPPKESSGAPAWLISVLAVVVVACGVALAWVLVGKRPVPAVAPTDVRWPVSVARNDLYGDEINDTFVILPGRKLTGALLEVDRYGVDGLLTGGPVAVGAFAGIFRQLQNGYVRSYALSVLGGGVVLVLALMVVNWQ